MGEPRKNSIRIVSRNLGILEFCLLITVIFILPLGCSNKAGPSEVVEQWFSAIQKGDIEKALLFSIATDEDLRNIKEMSDDGKERMVRFFGGRDLQYEIVSEEIYGLEAKVKVQIKTANGEVRIYTVPLKEIDGQWRIDEYDPDDYE